MLHELQVGYMANVDEVMDEQGTVLERFDKIAGFCSMSDGPAGRAVILWQIGRQGSTSQVVCQQKMRAHAQTTADTACQRAAAESSRTYWTCAGRRGERPSVKRCPSTLNQE